MPVDFTGRDELLFGDPNKSVFGDTPIYARQRKSRGFAFSKPATAARPRGEPALSSGMTPRAPRKSSAIPAAALIAAPAVIVLLGGAVFLMQPRAPATTDSLTLAAAEPATPALPELAPRPAAPEPAAAPIDKAAATPAPRTEAAPRATQVARARPAPRAPTVEDLASDASATAPVAGPDSPAGVMAVNPEPLAIPAAPAPTAPTPVDPAAVNPPPAVTGADGAMQAPVPDASAVTP
jgi:hypothetical protein